MLIEIKAHTGIEFVNPDQITHVSVMRGYMLIHLVNQAMLPIDPQEWERIQPLVALPPTVLEERYHTALRTIYRQAGRIQALEAQLNPSAADDDDDAQQTYIDINEPL